MNSSHGNGDRAAGLSARVSRREATAVRQAIRAAVTQLSLLNHQVGGHLELRPGDLYCLELIDSHGAISPTVLARMAGLHPATMTGVLDRLERGRWIVRERDPADRRGIMLRMLRERRAEIGRLYAGMNDALDRICADYTDAELALIAEFLTRATQAGSAAAEDLARLAQGTAGSGVGDREQEAPWARRSETS